MAEVLTSTGAVGAQGAAAAKPDTGAGSEQPPGGVTETSTGEQKPAETRPAEGAQEQEQARDEKKDAAAAQEKSQPKPVEFTIPEGVTVTEGAVDSFRALANEHQITSEQAQALVDWQIEANKAQEEAWQGVLTEWADQTKRDPEIGGPKLKESLSLARQAIEKFGDPKTIDALLESTGLGNHPEVIRMLARAGKAIAEDKFRAGEQSGPPRSLADILYPQQHQ